MRRVWLALVVASLGWGTAGVATRAALGEGVGPYGIAMLRAGLGAIGIVIYLVARRGGLPRGHAVWRVGLMMGITNFAIPYILSNLALQYASAGFLGLTTALIPLLTGVIAHFWLVDERMTLVRSMGLILGLGGVAVLLTSGDSGLTEGGRPMLAGVYALIAVLSIAAGGVYAKQYAGQYRPTEVVGIHFVSGSIVIATTTLIIEGAPAGLTGNAWALIVYMALGSTVLPFILYYWMIRTVSATFASMAGYLVTLIAVIAGMVFLDERLQPGILIGGVLILVGVVIGERAERAARRSIPVEEALGH